MIEMTIILLIFLNIIVFFMGKALGKVEMSIQMRSEILRIIDAVKKVEQVSSLKGEDISKMSVDDLMKKVKDQMNLSKNESE
jgi:hypothetical protein